MKYFERIFDFFIELVLWPFRVIARQEDYEAGEAAFKTASVPSDTHTDVTLPSKPRSDAPQE